MSKPKTIWVVESGCYSDYCVNGVFSSEANAKLYAERISGRPYSERAEVAEWPLDPSITEITKGYRCFHIVMLRDGAVESIQDDDDAFDYAGSLSMWRRTQAPAYAGKGIPDALSGRVLAKNAKHAIKIANERRLALIASGEWGEP